MQVQRTGTHLRRKAFHCTLVESLVTVTGCHLELVWRLAADNGRCNRSIGIWRSSRGSAGLPQRHLLMGHTSKDPAANDHRRWVVKVAYGSPHNRWGRESSG